MSALVDGSTRETLVRDVTQKVMALLNQLEPGESKELGTNGYESVDDALEAATEAQRAWQWDFLLEERIRIINEMRKELLDAKTIKELSIMALEETGMGRVDDKILKKRLALEKTPGPEFFRVNAITGDHGLALEELSPFGVIAAITPSTNPVASVFNNTICMIAGGNGVVFAPHPTAARSTLHTVNLVARSLERLGAPRGLVVTLTEPSMNNLEKLIRHPKIRMVVATGGPGVVNAALASGKPAVGAGPGNPPVLVDETADLRKAALDVIMGCSFDNNLTCIAEKELFVVNCVADELKKHMLESGLAFELKNPRDIDKLLSLVIKNGNPSRAMVGKSPQYILSQIGMKIPANARIILVETPEKHPFVQEELLMPILPMTRVADFEEGLAASLRAEHGFRHSAVIHSTNIHHMSVMARMMETTIFTKNAPSFASIGYGGDCPTAFTIATTTGQGPTTPLSFCRVRRCVLAGSFRIV
ncbi:MAG: aldehyde dehydrogenase EutE [Synergistaceae bacterium]|nr:aldehyde dehydrogenase EutE [Synergistaceae bacterium]